MLHLPSYFYGININAYQENNTGSSLIQETLTVADSDGNLKVLKEINYERIGLGKKFIPTPWFFSQNGLEAQAIRSYLYRPALNPSGNDNTPYYYENNVAFRYQKNVPAKLVITAPSLDIEMVC